MADTNLKLKELRVENRMTQQEVAEKLSCSMPVYARYERGERPCSIDILTKLSALYKKSIECILGLPEPQSSELSEKEHELVQLFREVDTLTQDDVLMLLKRHRILGTSAPQGQRVRK